MVILTITLFKTQYFKTEVSSDKQHFGWETQTQKIEKFELLQKDKKHVKQYLTS